jgi:hypothetical protein
LSFSFLEALSLRVKSESEKKRTHTPCAKRTFFFFILLTDGSLFFFLLGSFKEGGRGGTETWFGPLPGCVHVDYPALFPLLSLCSNPSVTESSHVFRAIHCSMKLNFFFPPISCLFSLHSQPSCHLRRCRHPSSRVSLLEREDQGSRS